MNKNRGYIAMSYVGVNQVFLWLKRTLRVENATRQILNDKDSPINTFNELTKQKIMIIVKLLLANEDKEYLNFPSKDATIMANAISVILMMAKLCIKDIIDDFYGYMGYLDERVSSGEMQEQRYKQELDNCQFTKNFLDNLELIDFNNEIRGSWVNDKDGDQLLIIKYKDSPCCRHCCHCHNTDSSDDDA